MDFQDWFNKEMFKQINFKDLNNELKVRGFDT